MRRRRIGSIAKLHERLGDQGQRDQKQTDTYQVDEACLSYPGKVYRMKRFRSIRVDYWTVEYNKEMKEYMYKQVLGIMKGDDALTFQHEVDHGNGKTIAMSIRERRNR